MLLCKNLCSRGVDERGSNHVHYDVNGLPSVGYAGAPERRHNHERVCDESQEDFDKGLNAFQMLIQTTYIFLAIMMDNKDLKLAVFSPLFVVGFKEVRNFKIKSLFDILSRREMKWGTLTRVGTSETKSTVKPTNSIRR